MLHCHFITSNNFGIYHVAKQRIVYFHLELRRDLSFYLLKCIECNFKIFGGFICKAKYIIQPDLLLHFFLEFEQA